MYEDVLMIPQTEGAVNFEVTGSINNIGLLLLQRLYVMLLSDPQTGFRNSDGGQTLLRFLDGSNIPLDSIMDTYLALSCATAVSMLDSEDKKLIKSFKGKSVDGKIICTLTLKDGTTVQGHLNG